MQLLFLSKENARNIYVLSETKSPGTLQFCAIHYLKQKTINAFEKSL